MHKGLHTDHPAAILFGLLALLGLSVAIGIGFGSTSLDHLSHPSPEDQIILFDIRLPRVLLALVVGMGLSVAGVAFQALLRNPLADPYNLGVSGGAALGSVLASSVGATFFVSTGVAFLGALISVASIYALATKHGRLSTSSLLLAGVVFNAFAISAILFVFNFLDPQSFQHVFFQLIGSLDGESWPVIAGISALIIAGTLVLWTLAHPLNILLFGEDTATSLGLTIEPYRRLIFFVTSAIVSVAVSVSGLIGFIGLCVPHIARLLFGSDHRILVPSAALLGASFLILADTCARTLLSSGSLQTELPVGVVTTLLGAPFFAFLLRRNRHVA